MQSCDPITCRDQDSVLAEMHESVMVTDCKSLFDAVERHQGQGLGLSEKRTAVEVLSIRQICQATGVRVKWVNSDRQLADILTKGQVPIDNLRQVLEQGKWRIVFDPDYVSAKKLRKSSAIIISRARRLCQLPLSPRVRLGKLCFQKLCSKSLSRMRFLTKESKLPTSPLVGRPKIRIS